MTLPRVLVVDDQYARDATEWALFLGRGGFVEATAGRRASRTFSESAKTAMPIAEVALCSGQLEKPGRVENDYSVVREAVRTGVDRGEYWALVLLDVTFDSGELRDQIPRGQAGDGEFGEMVQSRLAMDFPSMPIVMLTSKRQDELVDRDTPYLSKQGLDRRAVQLTLLRHGRLDPFQTRSLLDLAEGAVAEAPGILAAFREAFLHAPSRVPILVLGESGTGKEVLARYVHRLSGRKGPFIAVNIAALPRDLLESELFGVEKGAATGVGERPGKLELANGGTLFLDEIGDMPLDAQAKILRALQEREIYRIGGRSPIALDIDLVCATSRDLTCMIVERAFREDLYYRINTVPITVPPLRERREDIAPLARVFLNKAAATSGKTGISLAPAAIEMLEAHSFPGNVRELENLIKRLASAAGQHELIGREAVARALSNSASTHVTPPPGGTAVVPMQSVPLSLTTLPGTLAEVSVDAHDAALAGIKPRLDDAYRALLRRLAGAALERCRDPVSGVINRQRAMQLLTGDPDLKGKGPGRVVNEILGRKQDSGVTEEDLNALVSEWKCLTDRGGKP